VGSVILLIWASLPQANPLAVTFRPVWRTFTRKRYFLYIAIGLSVVFIDVALTAVDHEFTDAVLKSRGQDFTSLIWAMEGDLVKHFQTWTWTPLTWVMGWAYIIVFPAMVPWAMAVFDHLGEVRKNISLLIGYIMNYLLVLPFYIFFPVRECHVFSSPEGEGFVRLALDDVHPAIMTILRPMSGIDNCFPSFHTSLAVTVALFAIRSGRRAFAVVMTAMAAAIIFSTVYLGVHWLTDVGAGIIVGVVAYVLGEWLGKRLHSRLRTPAA
jgi:membrane-associated phospholipid phosphatase